MENFGEYSDSYSSFSDETSVLLETATKWTPGTRNSRPVHRELPPLSPSLRAVPRQRNRSTLDAPDSVLPPREEQYHNLSITRRSPDLEPIHQHTTAAREPHFELPNFPLPRFDRGNQSLPFSEIQGLSDWEDPHISPLSRPASRISWASNNSWGEFLFSQSDFVDLTDELSPPSNMPAAHAKRRPPMPVSGNSTQTAESSSKRRKTAAGARSERLVKDEDIEEVDLRDVDDDNELSKALQKQHETAIKAQRKEESDKPLKLSGLQCIICLESMKDITATSCGHLFCHGCLMEALIAGEQQEVEPGKYNSRCPVCRKKISRPKVGNQKLDVIPMEIKFKTKGQLATEKLKVSIRD